MHDALIANLATFIQRNDLAAALIAEHRCTPGGRCSCSTPNVGRPWPCVTYKAVEQVVRPFVPQRRVG